jgi:predicted GIY-YIG superfamily endonuclease
MCTRVPFKKLINFLKFEIVLKFSRFPFKFSGCLLGSHPAGRSPLQQLSFPDMEKEGKRPAVEKPEKSHTYFCYLLRSHHQVHKGSTYIGFTTHPLRRIRQHNGLIANGAFKTRNKRPWEMVVNVYGFPNKVSALQFEWAWQNPKKSRLLRVASVSAFKTGVIGRLQTLYVMLSLQPWSQLLLTVHFVDLALMDLRKKCAPPPAHVQVTSGPLESLPLYAHGNYDDDSASGSDADDSAAAAAAMSQASGGMDDDEKGDGHGMPLSQSQGQPDDLLWSCAVCNGVYRPLAHDMPPLTTLMGTCGRCGVRNHLLCLARMNTARGGPLVPREARCIECGFEER